MICRRTPPVRSARGGSHGVGFRAAWFYRDPGFGLRFALLGYSFTGVEATDYLDTLFHCKGADDAEWAFSAWRSITHEPEATSAGDEPQR
ncbi:hypothetical protein KRMM14A1259_62620 [Krasilnikovia sp. MM14-A1259]